jgi:hypothetical protein
LCDSFPNLLKAIEHGGKLVVGKNSRLRQRACVCGTGLQLALEQAAIKVP